MAEALQHVNAIRRIIVTENKGHIEFRKSGERKFYAPDRDLLHIYPSIIKAALSATNISLSEDEFNAGFKQMVKDLASIHNESVTTDKSGTDIMHDAIKNLYKTGKCYKVFLDNLMTSLGLAYINAMRDSAEKPVLSEDAFEKALKTSTILARMDKECREKVLMNLKMAVGDMSTFDEGEKAFEEVKS